MRALAVALCIAAGTARAGDHPVEPLPVQTEALEAGPRQGPEDESRACGGAAGWLDPLGECGGRGAFSVGAGASISLFPSVALRPTLDLGWTRGFGDAWGLGLRVSSLLSFNTASVSLRRRLLDLGELRLSARAELFGELSMGAGQVVELDPLTTWMRPLFGVAPGVAVTFRDQWAVVLDIPLALPGLTGVTSPGSYAATSWVRPYLRPAVASVQQLNDTFTMYSSIQLLLGPSVLAPIVSVGVAF